MLNKLGDIVQPYLTTILTGNKLVNLISSSYYGPFRFIIEIFDYLDKFICENNDNISIIKLKNKKLNTNNCYK